MSEARDLPDAERRLAAQALSSDVDAVLTDRVQDDTAIAMWTQLARLAEPAATTRPSAATARAAAMALVDGADPLGDVSSARKADVEARERAGVARERLREAAVAAVAAGVETSSVARAAGVSRPTLYEWIGE